MLVERVSIKKLDYAARYLGKTLSEFGSDIFNAEIGERIGDEMRIKNTAGLKRTALVLRAKSLISANH